MSGRSVPGDPDFRSLKPLCYKLSRLTWIPHFPLIPRSLLRGSFHFVKIYNKDAIPPHRKQWGILA
jgi:hypothetical protein